MDTRAHRSTIITKQACELMRNYNGKSYENSTNTVFITRTMVDNIITFRVPLLSNDGTSDCESDTKTETFIANVNKAFNQLRLVLGEKKEKYISTDNTIEFRLKGSLSDQCYIYGTITNDRINQCMINDINDEQDMRKKSFRVSATEKATKLLSVFKKSGKNSRSKTV